MGRTYELRALSMMQVQLGLPAWVPGVIVAAVGTVLAMWRAQAVFDIKLSALEKLTQIGRSEDHEMSVELKEAVRSIHAVATDVRVIIAEQAVVNKVTNLALEGIATKLEGHAHDINEIKQQIVLLREITTGDCKPTKPCWKESA